LVYFIAIRHFKAIWFIAIWYRYNIWCIFPNFGMV
jgi:hypothetical protein